MDTVPNPPAAYPNEARSPADGLSSAEVARLTAEGKVNTPVKPPLKTKSQIIVGNICTYFNLIFLIIAIALLFAGAYNHMTFLPVITANTVIGIVQELRSRKKLDALQLLNTQMAQVIRDGRETRVPTSELVLGDLVIFAAGDQISADAQVVEGEANVNESLVTGESDEIMKKTGDELLSGSFIVSGSCRARLTQVGSDSFASRLTVEAKKQHRRQQPGMMRSLTLLIGIIGIIIIPIAVLLFWRQHTVLHRTVAETITSTAAALLGMIPDGLYLLVSVALAVSLIRLSKRKTLVHESKSIETLARVDVLCVDKTGTITENEMRVSQVVPLKPGDENRMAAEAILSDFAAAMSGDNQTIASLRAYFTHPTGRAPATVVPFSSVTKYSGVSFGPGQNYLLGAPEFLLRAQYPAYRSVVEGFASQGNRVLLLAGYAQPLSGGPLLGEVLPIAYVLLRNEVRPSAVETFSYFAKQGVTVKVISGDNPVTVADAARRAGIPGADQYVDATTLDTKEKIAKAAEEKTVFGRVTPEQKRSLIRALKRAGHTVAMTGDGVNDVLALKEADCSIAMASGSDIASQVSQIVLLDSDFSAMPAVVAEGRRVINNIERSAALFLVKNIFSFFLAWITILAAFAYPIVPAQLTLINVTTIGIPSFILALEPNTSLIRGKFLRNVMYRAFPAALTDLTVILGVVCFASAFQIPYEQSSTVAAILIGIVGMIMLIRVSSPLNVVRSILVGAMAVIFLLGVLLLPELLSMVPLSYGSWLVLAVFAMLAFPLMRAYTKIFEWASRLFGTLHSKIQDYIG